MARSTPVASVKRVLLVYLADGTLPAYLDFDRSLAETLYTTAGPRVEFYREQLNSIRFPEYRERRIAELRSLYSQRKVDVVIFFGGVPIDVLPGIPVVQVDTGLSERMLSKVYGSNWVHVVMNIDARKTVDAARRLQPAARKVLLISGTAVYEYIEIEQFRQQLSGQRNLAIEVVSNASVPELRALVSRLPRDVIVLPVDYSRDPEGNNYIPRDVMGQLAEASTAPVYGVSDTFIGKGLVGGYVINMWKLGDLVGDAAAQILHGKLPAQVVLKRPGAASYVFDWRQLKRWGFSEKDLPPGSIVKYKVPTAWEQYRWRIVGICVLLVAQSLLIVSLLIQRRKRRSAEDSLRDMTGRLLQSQDDERRRMARDLHDGTGQHLSGIALCVGQVLADFPPGYDRLRQLLQDSHVASRQALYEVRAVSYALHPPILDGLGLIPALRWYLDGLQKRTSFSIDFEAPTELPNTTPDAERALFRIVQESITNVLHHSGGTAIRVKVFDDGKAVTLEIEDNGHGMSTEELQQVERARSLGVGIAGMRERVRQLHGTFNISSNDGGTRVLVSLPRYQERYAAHSVS